MSGRTYSARVVRFRQGVYAARGSITPGCQVLLLRLSDDMNANCVVSIPRSRLTEEFGCDKSRITEWMNQAKAAGFLSVVRRGRPGVTAVYQGAYVAPMVRESAPTHMVRKPGPHMVRESAPQNDPTWCARADPQEGVQVRANGTAPESPLLRRGSDEEQVS